MPPVVRRFNVELPRAYRTTFALGFVEPFVEAAFRDDFTRTPAARQKAIRRFGAGGLTVFVENDFFEGPELLRVAVSRKDFDQSLTLRIVILLRELLIPGWPPAPSSRPSAMMYCAELLGR